LKIYNHFVKVVIVKNILILSIINRR